MTLRTLPDHCVLTPGHTWTPSGFLTGQALAVAAGRFSWVGPASDLPVAYSGWQTVDLGRYAVVPGMVDCHQHLAQTLGRPHAFGEPSEIFRRVWVPLEGALTADELAVSARLGLVDALLGGFTTVADAGARSRHDPEIIAAQARQTGVRLVLGKISHDVGVDAGGQGTGPDEVLAGAAAHLDRYAADPWVHGSVAVATPEMATQSTLARLSDLCRDTGAVLQTHVDEHLAGVERTLLSTGQRPLGLLRDAGALDRHLLAAHTTLLTAREKMQLARSGAAWSYNPVASAWKGNAVADALTLTALGARTGLGTDGTRCDAFRLMDAAETAQRLTSAMAAGDPVAGGGDLWLRAATSGGADAVGLGDEVGTLAAGYRADLLVLRLDTPDFVCTVDLAWQLVRLGHRGQIHAVITDGTTRVLDGELLDSDLGTLIEDARAASAAACTRAGLGGREVPR